MFVCGLGAAWRRGLVVSAAWAVLLAGVGPTVAAAQNGNGLYSPFPTAGQHSGFFERIKIRITSNELARGKFLMAGNVPPGLALSPAPAGAPSARAGVGDPRDPGALGWLLGVGAVALVAGLGAATPEHVRRWRAAR